MPLWEHDLAGGLRMLQVGVHTHLITFRAAVPLILKTAAATGTHGLVVEMTDGTSAANAEFRRNVGLGTRGRRGHRGLPLSAQTGAARCSAGGWPQPVALLVLGGCTLACTGLAARLFRWE